jgi:hypothetical protein
VVASQVGFEVGQPSFTAGHEVGGPVRLLLLVVTMFSIDGVTLRPLDVADVELAEPIPDPPSYRDKWRRRW